jgi:hypothetical protein
MVRPNPPLRPDHLDERELAGEVVGEDAHRVLAAEALPVVARLVVEIRSDGTRTIARGAMEDPEGQRVALEVQGTTPWALAKQLAGALWRMPRLPRPSLRALLPGRRRRGEG